MARKPRTPTPEADLFRRTVEAECRPPAPVLELVQEVTFLGGYLIGQGRSDLAMICVRTLRALAKASRPD